MEGAECFIQIGGSESILKCIFPGDTGVRGTSRLDKTFIAVLGEAAKNWKMFKCPKTQSPSKPQGLIHLMEYMQPVE